MKRFYENFTKRALLLMLTVHLSLLSFAATYYISSAGSDSNSGLTVALAWKTLAKVNAATFKAGDQILFQRGDTFYGTLNVKSSGVSGNLITYGAYGTGENPIITGFTTVTAWTYLGSNIWESTNTVSTLSTCNVVSINGVNTPMGKYPNEGDANKGYIFYQSHSGKTSLTSNSLTGTPNWAGAEVVIRSNQYILDRRVITSQTGGTITWANDVNLADGQPFFIQNDSKTLDQQNEWYYNPITKKFRIYSFSQPKDVKVSSIETIVNIGGSNYTSYGRYTVFENIAFLGANSYGFYNDIHWMNKMYHTVIRNCTISFTGISALVINGLYQTFENNIVSDSNGDGVLYNYSKRVVVKNNTIANTAIYKGMTQGWGATSALSVGNVVNALIEYNRIINSGYDGINFSDVQTDSITIRNNFINTFCTVLSDGGGIYGNRNAKISNNIVINGGLNQIKLWLYDPWSVGIYLDDNSFNNEVYGNTIFKCNRVGIYLHNSLKNNIYNNSIFANTIWQIYVVDDDTEGMNVANNTITNNLFISKEPNQEVAYFQSGYDNLSKFGSFDKNYYARPISDNTTIRIYQPTGGAGIRTIDQWKSFSGLDKNSQKSSQGITDTTDFKFEYNETKTAKTVTLTRSMIDVTGTKYSGSITLQPFTSLILMKDMTAAVVPNAPTSVVATAGNASASVTFVVPTSNGGSAITGYTVTSIPAGGVDTNAGSTSLTHTITGLTNGTSYTFTVKASNSVGTSVASVASNSVIPKAPAATSFQFTGPSSGNVNSASTNFSVTPNNPYTGTITITPTGAGSAGLSAIVLTFSNSSTAKTFTINPTVAGSIILTPSDNSSLTNPAKITYTANAVVSGVPTFPVATAGDASASVTFAAPTNNGGSAITGYTVTSIPAGGVDANAGSTSLIHTITGLKNGTSYMFTVKATNSVGTSAASAASNAVMPVEVVIKQGEITPSHFATVWQGSNGLNHMNIIVASATLEDIPLTLNDEIAVYNGSACVGAAKLTKSIISTDNTSFLTILASQSDGSNNGFIENDTILFKVWDNTNKVEKQINGVVYRKDVSTWKTTGRYIPGSTAMVEISSYKVYTQSIELLKGYNMISTYVSAPDPSASVVTKPLIDQGNLIKLQDETGNSFENWGDFGGWINQLGSLEKTEGYKIQVANNCTLQVTGRTIAMPLNISLKTGWNIISYPRTDVVNALNVVQALIDQNKLVKVQDEAGNSIENWGLFGGWKNGIGNFIPGKAYKVKMNADAILTFQESYPKSAVVLAKSEETEYFNSSIEGNGTDHMNINITGLNSIGISLGDELAAFDGGICVATTKITEANLTSGSASLVSSFSTNDQIPNGFKVGDPIQISLWSQLSGDESKVTTEVVTGQMKYEKNSSVLIQMKSATITTSVTDLDDLVKIDVFPNPCQGKFTVRFSEVPEANSRVEILDISGRKLISRLVSGTSEEFNLESFTSGLYLVKSTLGTKEHIHKLIVNK